MHYCLAPVRYAWRAVLDIFTWDEEGEEVVDSADSTEVTAGAKTRGRRSKSATTTTTTTVDETVTSSATIDTHDQGKHKITVDETVTAALKTHGNKNTSK